MRARIVGTLFACLAAVSAAAQVPAGGPFRVNTYTTGDQQSPRFSILPNGESVAVWTSRQQENSIFGLFSQRYRADGTPLGGEFRVDSGDFAGLSAVAQSDNTGRFMVVWHDGTGVSNFDVHGRRFSANGAPRGAEFMVNTSTTGNEYRPDIAPLFGGGFVVVWSENYSYTQNQPARILAQRYDGFGVPAGAETVVNVIATGSAEIFPRVAAVPDGRFVVTWLHSGVTSAIQARVFDAAGNPSGPPVSVPSAPQGADAFPGVAMRVDGGFVVTWQSGQVVGGPSDVVARLFAPGGTPLGPQFVVSSTGAGNRSYPVVGADFRGNFVIAWTSGSGPTKVAMGRRFELTGTPRGGDFPISTNTTGVAAPSDIAVDITGNFVVSWTASSEDGSGYSAMARRFGGLIPSPMTADTAASGTSDGNGVLEPGETVDVRPSWHNVNEAAQTFTGTIEEFFGPPGPSYTIVDGGADYGSVANGATGACISSDCYRLGVSAPATRPVQHWDGFFSENLSPDTLGERKGWRLHIGDTFTDVPRSSTYYRFVETLIHNYITAGCTNTSYCPQTPTTREQMAVFVLVARDAAGDAPPVCTTPLFNDVPASSGYCRWIEELAKSGVVNGCGNGAFCPQAPVSREQMSIFMLRTLDGTLTPPACVAGSERFTDVPASSPFCRWIEELARRGIVTGCGGGKFCPTDTVTREQMAVFITGTFGLKLYGPLP